MGPFKVLTSLFFYIQNSRQLSLLKLPSLLRPCFFWRSHIYQHCDFLLGLLQLAHLHCATWPIWPSSAQATLSSHPCLQASYPPRPLRIFSLCTFTTALGSWLFLYTSCFLFPLDSLRVLQWNEDVFKPGALNYYSLFCLILLTLFVSRNLTLIHLLLFESLHSLLCDMIAPTPGLAFSFPISPTLAAASTFLSDRAYLSQNFLPPLFLRWTPTLILIM